MKTWLSTVKVTLSTDRPTDQKKVGREGKTKTLGFAVIMRVCHDDDDAHPK